MDAPKEPQQNKAFLKDVIKIFVIPNVFNKPIMLYFGVKYAKYPGEGYGYGLAATILVFLTSIAIFLYKYRNIEDP